jgi:phenylacetate-coenzyme A ligase PaaK-like adenylate-forming protein
MELPGQFNHLFNIRTDHEFNAFALELFRYQYRNNPVYQQYVDYLIKPDEVIHINHYTKIPFLPIELFKSQKILCKGVSTDQVFMSSGTTGTELSRHYVADIKIYEESLKKCFELFIGDPANFLILALLPSYLDREGSSLVYMVQKLIESSRFPNSGFYLNNFNDLVSTLKDSKGKSTILLGVSFALLDLAESYNMDLSDVIIMETGGMKGRRSELTREELHHILCTQFNLDVIYSEYGMTELLSQAYSTGSGFFNTPPWMKVLIRDTNDPKSYLKPGQTGGINIIDLANVYSCAFIATQDLGKVKDDGSFEVLGRFDFSDIRGCNLLVN